MNKKLLLFMLLILILSLTIISFIKADIFEKSKNSRIQIQTAGQSWNIVKQTGNESIFDVSFANAKDKKTDICFTLKNGINPLTADLTDKCLFNNTGGAILDDKNKAICLKYETAKCSGKDGYHISLTSAQSINVDNYIKLGTQSIIMVYEDINTVLFSINDNSNITATLYKNIDGDWNNTVNSIFVRIDNETYKFGADDNYSTGYEQYKYLIKSNTNLYNWNGAYWYISGDEGYKINLEDICSKPNANCGITQNGNSLEVIFYSNGTIDPTITVSGIGNNQYYINASYEATAMKPFVHANANQNILAYYNFDNDLANTSDIWTPGQVGNGLNLTGAGTYVQGKTLPQKPLSISLWFYTPRKISNTCPTQKNGLLDFGQLNDGYYTFGYMCEWGGALTNETFLIGSHVLGNFTYLKNIEIPIGWHHLVVVSNDTNSYTQIYLDGIDQNATLVGGGAKITNKSLYIGRSHVSSTNYYFNGTIDEVKIWNRNLSPEEVNGIYITELAGIQNSTIPTDGLMANYHFDETQEYTTNDTVYNNTGYIYGYASTIFDMSGSNYDAIYTGQTSILIGSAINSAGGKFGRALQSAGNSYATSFGKITNSNIYNAQPPITVSLWVKNLNNSNTGSGYDSGVYSRDVKGLGIECDSGAHGMCVYKMFITNTSGGSLIITGNSSLQYNNWVHLVATYNGTEIRFYQDGRLWNSRNYSGNIPNANYGSIGYGRSYFNDLYYFNGLIDDILVMNVSLGLEDVLRLYNNSYQKYYPTATVQHQPKQISPNSNNLNVSFTDFISLNSTIRYNAILWNISFGYINGSADSIWHLDNSNFSDSKGSYPITSGVSGNGMFGEGIKSGTITNLMSTPYGSNPSASFSWSFYINHTVGTAEGLISNGNPTIKQGYQIWVDSSDQIHIGIGSGSQTSCNAGALTKGWHHVIIIYNNTVTPTIVCYLDGVRSSNNPFYGINTTTSGNDVTIGSAFDDSGATTTLLGSLDELHFFNSAMDNPTAITESSIGYINWTNINSTIISQPNTDYIVYIGTGWTNLIPTEGYESISDTPINYGSSIITDSANITNITSPESNFSGLKIDFVPPTSNLSLINQSSVFINLSVSSTLNNQYYIINDFDSSLIGWYRMDDLISNIILDKSSYNISAINNGTIINKTGVYGNASHSDSTQNIIINSSIGAQLDSTDFTFSMWYYLSNFTDSSSCALIDRGSWYADRQFSFFLYNNYSGWWSVGGQIGEAWTSPDDSFTLNKWHNLIITRNATNTSLLLDGDFKASTLSFLPWGYYYDSLDPLYLFANPSGFSPICGGGVDEVIIFNRSLNYNEMQSLINGTKYSYYNNFTGLQTANHTDIGWVVDTTGIFNFTSNNFSVLAQDLIPPKVNGNYTIPTPAYYSYGGVTGTFYVNVTDYSGVSKVALTRNGINFTATNLGSGVYRVQIVGLGVGTYNYCWWANDSYNNINNTTCFTYIVDKGTPTINLTLNGVRNNLTLNQSTLVQINASTIEIGTDTPIFNLTINGTLVNQSFGNLSYNYNFLNSGLYIINATFNPTQNYTISSESWYVNLSISDITAPVITIYSPIQIASSNNISFNFSAVDENNISNMWFSDGTNNYTYNGISKYINISNGRYNITFYANDSYNNIKIVTVPLYVNNQIVIGGTDFKQFWNQMNKRRVDIVGIGDSNQLSSGYGWDEGWQYALNLSGYPIYATELISGSENNGTGGGIGFTYAFTASGTQNGNQSGMPIQLLNYMNGTLSPALYMYLEKGSNFTAGNNGMTITSGGLINVSSNLTLQLSYGMMNDSNGGAFYPIIRYDESPYSTLLTCGWQNSSNNGTGQYGIKYLTNCTLAPATRTKTLGIRWNQQNVQSYGKNFWMYMRVIDNNVKVGASYNTMLGQGGKSTRYAALTLTNANTTEIQEYIKEIAIGQNNAEPIMLFNIVHLANDVNDLNQSWNETAQSFTGEPSNTAQGFSNNNQQIIKIIKQNWISLGYDINNLYFMLGAYHPRNTTGFNDSLISFYNQTINDIINKQNNTGVVIGTSLSSSSEFLSNNWYYSASDDAHLKETGYQGYINMTFQALISYNPEPEQSADTTPPNVTGNYATPSPVNYTFGGITASFFVNVTDNSGVSKVALTRNGINFTATNLGSGKYRVQISGLSAGSYNYCWWANDSYNNINDTTCFTYAVDKGTPTINLTLNGIEGNITINQSTLIQINASPLSFGIDGGYKINLTINGTLVNWSNGNLSFNYNFSDFGIFVINATYQPTQNFTWGSETWIVNFSNLTISNESSPPSTPPQTGGGGINTGISLNNITSLPKNFNFRNITDLIKNNVLTTIHEDELCNDINSFLQSFAVDGYVLNEIPKDAIDNFTAYEANKFKLPDSLILNYLNNYNARCLSSSPQPAWIWLKNNYVIILIALFTSGLIYFYLQSYKKHRKDKKHKQNKNNSVNNKANFNNKNNQIFQ